jgi:prolipoprotein diacylglyceryl transferase
MDMFGYVYWPFHPEILRVGPLVFRWYGLLFALGFYFGFLIARWQFRIEGKNENDLNPLLFYMVGGALIGARLGHCWLYEPGYYVRHPLEMLRFWEGGLASHGGTLGILIALYFYARRRPDQPYLWLLDRVVVPTGLAGALIRIGNLFNSEMLGLPSTVPWAWVFPRVDQTPRHPVQLYESLAYLFTLVVLIRSYARRRAQTPRGSLLGLFLVLVFTFRFFLEFFKERQATYEQHFPISVGQWLSVPLVLGGLVLLWRARRTPPTTPGATPPRTRS